MFHKTSTKVFVEQLHKNKQSMLAGYSWHFPEYTKERYDYSNCYISDTGSVFAIDDNHEIISLTPSRQDFSGISQIVKNAIDLGGETAFVSESFSHLFQQGGLSEIIGKVVWNKDTVPDDLVSSFNDDVFVHLGIPDRYIEEREITETFDSLSIRDKLKLLNKDKDKNVQNTLNNNKKIDDDFIL